MKSSIVKVLSLACVMLCLSNVSQAQLRWGFYINGVLPTGQFTSDVSTADRAALVPLTMSDMGKGATLGFGGGVRATYHFDVGTGMVAPFVNLDLFWNSIDSKLSNAYSDARLDAPSYFNFPLFVGATYLYDELWNDITPFVEFGLGPDLMIITSEGTDSKEFRYGYKNTTSMAFMIGLGSYFGRHVSAGIYYYGLGTHSIDYTTRTLRNNELAAAQDELYRGLNQRERRSVGELALRIGFHF